MKAASMPYNSDEISHANEEVATKAASKEIIGKLVEATQTFDLEAMAYGIQQAIAMQLSDAPEVVEAEKLLKQATTAKLALQSALESSVLDDLELAVALARPFAFLAEDVARAEALGKSIYENDMDARVALFFMERPMLDAVYDKAHATKLESNLIKEIRDALSLDPTKFIQLQL
ncbi:high molecular weight form of myosin1, putative, partial [Acanthamoeba castellanii str. Neff]